MSESSESDKLASDRKRFAFSVVEQLRTAGFEALWAGGCVRDIMLDRPPIDYDVATSARPEQVRELFGHRKTLAVGASFGVIIVRGPNANSGQVEVATFRNDGDYSDGRRPDRVVFSTAKEDALRRDFTINGMFFDPISSQVIDYVNGKADLERGIIRAIGDPDQRIREDKLRMLRAVRFAARFGFSIEAATQSALARHAAELAIVSGERMAAEMEKTLITSGREMAIRQWAETGLLRVLIPQLALQWSELGDEICRLVRDIQPVSWIAVLAAMLYPLTRRAPTVDEHATPGSPGARGWNNAVTVTDLRMRLKLSNDAVERLRLALDCQAMLCRASTLPWSDVQPILVDPMLAEGLALLAARVAADDVRETEIEWIRERLAWPREQLDPPALITGHDLHTLGFHSGPMFKSLLSRVRKLQLEGQVVDRDQALEWLVKQLPG